MAAHVDDLETLFKALADRTRLRILGLMAAGEVCVCDIHESLGIPQPKASRHLAYLRRAGLVRARKLPKDPVSRTILDAATHGLRHVPETARDAARLEERTGCCSPTTVARPEFACCAGPHAPQPVVVSRATPARGPDR
jgi:ArsR family transcriptional regulator